jgi:uncharacterized protein
MANEIGQKVLITGGTGVIGNRLCEKLAEKGYKVSILSRTRRPNAEVPTYAWDIEKGEIEEGALESIDHIIHLAGAGIGDRRWTTQRKKLILDSRILSCDLIFDKLKNEKGKIKSFISASAIGYYGAYTSDKIFCETDPPANDFLGETCKLWEESVDRFEMLGIRTVKIRMGLVLAKNGGVLKKLLFPVQMGLASAIGDGKQYMPWIHIDDLCDIYIKALEDTRMNGAYNAVAPEHKTNKEFIMTLAHVLKKPIWIPNIPGFVLKCVFGKMSQILLKGSRVSAVKISKAGYQFLFPTLERALHNLLIKR